MTVKYLHLIPENTLPDISELSPFRSIVIIEEPTSSDWQNDVSDWLVKSGCLYVMAWGIKCDVFHDSIDFANLENHNFKDVPDEQHIMTTWHDDEPLSEVFWYSKNLAYHPVVELKNTLILHISKVNKEEDYLKKYSIDNQD